MALAVTDSTGITGKNRSGRSGPTHVHSGSKFTNELMYAGFEVMKMFIFWYLLLKIAFSCFCFVISCLAYSSLLRMAATCFSETSVDFHWTTQKTELFKVTYHLTTTMSRTSQSVCMVTRPWYNPKIGWGGERARIYVNMQATGNLQPRGEPGLGPARYWAVTSNAFKFVSSTTNRTYKYSPGTYIIQNEHLSTISAWTWYHNNERRCQFLVYSWCGCVYVLLAWNLCILYWFR
jgi:hypothetical protein